jgi:hypothetical protein
MADEHKTTRPVRWSVREEGNTVIVEVECRDDYQAIELCEVIAAGIREGHLELEFEPHE